MPIQQGAVFDWTTTLLLAGTCPGGDAQQGTTCLGGDDGCPTGKEVTVCLQSPYFHRQSTASMPKLCIVPSVYDSIGASAERCTRHFTTVII